VGHIDKALGKDSRGKNTNRRKLMRYRKKAKSQPHAGGAGSSASGSGGTTIRALARGKWIEKE